MISMLPSRLSYLNNIVGHYFVHPFTGIEGCHQQTFPYNSGGFFSDEISYSVVLGTKCKAPVDIIRHVISPIHLQPQ
jgi:hypothetical protein